MLGIFFPHILLLVSLKLYAYACKQKRKTRCSVAIIFFTPQTETVATCALGSATIFRLRICDMYAKRPRCKATVHLVIVVLSIDKCLLSSTFDVKISNCYWRFSKRKNCSAFLHGKSRSL